LYLIIFLAFQFLLAERAGLDPFRPYKRSLQTSFITQLAHFITSRLNVITLSEVEVFMVSVFILSVVEGVEGAEPRQMRQYKKECWRNNVYQ